jgi:hypothetical protein
MAGSMITSELKNTAARWGVAVFTLLISSPGPLHAEDLPDPTRPPAGIYAPVSRAGAGAAREATMYHSSGLHLVIISKTRRAAIIDGKTVELGENHGNARLVEVNEGSVVLQRGQSRQVLTLFHGVRITHKKAPGTESGEMESMDNELQVKQPSSTSKMQTEKDNSMPTEHEEGK